MTQEQRDEIAKWASDGNWAKDEGFTGNALNYWD